MITRALLVALLVVAGCSGGMGMEEPPQPPDVFANGIAGTTVSYCIANTYCADGGLDGTETGPVVELPVTLTFEQPVRHVTAQVSSTVRDWQDVELTGADAEGRPSTQTIRIARLPPGHWDALIVSVGMPEDVSVSAAWVLSK